MKDFEISFAVTGDALAVSPLSRTAPDLIRIRKEFLDCDVVMTNLEGSVHEYELDIYPSQISGGDWVTIPPIILDDLNWLGVNLYSLSNNHSFDWMCGGVVKTIQNLKTHGAAFAGIGSNLSEASQPAYFSTPTGRVALIAFTTSFEPWQKAGEQRRDVSGRPGVFGVSYESTYYITQNELDTLKAISKKSNIPFTDSKDGSFLFSNMKFQIGTPGAKTCLNKRDLQLIKNSINRAKRQADIVLVSCHSHENGDGNPDKNADFQEELAHFCIDCGAHAYIAHGPHVLRGIELYHNAPIFYGLGNFFYQCELIEKQPSEFYDKFKHFDSEACAADVFDYRVQAGGLLGETNPNYFQSIIAKFKLRDKKITEIKLIPIDLNFHMHRSTKGTPKIATGSEGTAILTHMEKLCRNYGTNLHIHSNYAAVNIPDTT